jgi:hypothetical protein
MKKPPGGGHRMSLAIAALLKPFVMFVLAACVLYPARKAVERFCPPGKVKNLLLRRVGP